MNYIQLAGGNIGLVAYVFLIIALMRTTIQQSFAAFLLWAMLDLIATITTIMEGRKLLACAFERDRLDGYNRVADQEKHVSWSWVKSMTAILVVVCLIVWYTTGEQAGIIASSSGCCNRKHSTVC